MPQGPAGACVGPLDRYLRETIENLRAPQKCRRRRPEPRLPIAILQALDQREAEAEGGVLRREGVVADAMLMARLKLSQIPEGKSKFPLPPPPRPLAPGEVPAVLVERMRARLGHLEFERMLRQAEFQELFDPLFLLGEAMAAGRRRKAAREAAEREEKENKRADELLWQAGLRLSQLRTTSNAEPAGVRSSAVEVPATPGSFASQSTTLQEQVRRQLDESRRLLDAYDSTNRGEDTQRNVLERYFPQPSGV